MAQKKAPERIALGSGQVFCTTFTGEIPEVDTLCVPENELAHVKNGASLEYTPEMYEATSDLGLVKKQVITSEEVLLKLGFITWNANTLKTFADTGRVTEDTSKKTRTIKIGGISNATNTRYVICFYHKDPIDGDIYILIVGQCQSGFTLTFAVDEETVIEPEFKALPMDDEGTLVMLIEHDETIGAETLSAKKVDNSEGK